MLGEAVSVRITLNNKKHVDTILGATRYRMIARPGYQLTTVTSSSARSEMVDLASSAVRASRTIYNQSLVLLASDAIIVSQGGEIC